MPFDCTPVIDPPKQFSLIARSGVEVRFLSITAPTQHPVALTTMPTRTLPRPNDSRNARAGAPLLDAIGHAGGWVTAFGGGRAADRACTLVKTYEAPIKE